MEFTQIFDSSKRLNNQKSSNFALTEAKFRKSKTQNNNCMSTQTEEQ
jgi:hypothetical protein